MSLDSQTFHRALSLIDAAHSLDPSLSPSDPSSPESEQMPSELLYADNVQRYAAVLLSPSRPLTNLEFIAARCQHLKRFQHPRSSYPDGKLGYLKWRKDLYGIQASYAVEILREAGVPEGDVQRVADSVSKKDLAPLMRRQQQDNSASQSTSMGKEEVEALYAGTGLTRLLEDAAVLVFLSEEVGGFKEKHEEYTVEKWEGIVRKTWRKLSVRGREVAKMVLPMVDEGVRGVVEKVVMEEEEKERQEMEKGE
jgi:hypothetical protein